MPAVYKRVKFEIRLKMNKTMTRPSLVHTTMIIMAKVKKEVGHN